jgi:hypothetical protein
VSTNDWEAMRRWAYARRDAKLAQSRQALEAWAERAVEFARQNAPWADNTGAARRGLGWRAAHPEGGGRVILVHGVSYGRHLELDFGGRFAIIGPTVATLAPQLYAELREIWR